MTTPNDEELRLEMESWSVCSDYRGLMSAKVIELLDRIDRLEAENERLKIIADTDKASADKFRAENEAKDRLLTEMNEIAMNQELTRGDRLQRIVARIVLRG